MSKNKDIKKEISNISKKSCETCMFFYECNRPEKEIFNKCRYYELDIDRYINSLDRIFSSMEEDR